MTAKLRLPDEEGKDQPKRRPIPDHIPLRGYHKKGGPASPIPYITARRDRVVAELAAA